jgi:hypothetical protein
MTFNDFNETYIGKSCDPYYTNYMSESEYKERMNFVKITSLLSILIKILRYKPFFDKAKYLVKKKN